LRAPVVPSPSPPPTLRGPLAWVCAHDTPPASLWGRRAFFSRGANFVFLFLASRDSRGWAYDGLEGPPFSFFETFFQNFFSLRRVECLSPFIYFSVGFLKPFSSRDFAPPRSIRFLGAHPTRHRLFIGLTHCSFKMGSLLNSSVLILARRFPFRLLTFARGPILSQITPPNRKSLLFQGRSAYVPSPCNSLPPPIFFLPHSLWSPFVGIISRTFLKSLFFFLFPFRWGYPPWSPWSSRCAPVCTLILDLTLPFASFDLSFKAFSGAAVCSLPIPLFFLLLLYRVLAPLQ